MDARTVADVWREWKEGIAGRPALEELENRWGHHWRLGSAMRMAWCRRKVVLDEVSRLIQSGLDPELAVATLDERRQQAGQSLPAFIRAIQGRRKG